MASKHICELAPWEVEDWRAKGVVPQCENHRHVSKLQAFEKTCCGDYQLYKSPIARWVGPRHIEPLADRVWHLVKSDGVHVLQLVPGTVPSRPAVGRALTHPAQGGLVNPR